MIISRKHFILFRSRSKLRLSCRIGCEWCNTVIDSIVESHDASFPIQLNYIVIELIICNPPFHASIAEAQKGSRRKIKNLSGKKVKTPKLNFSGISSELICDGGENRFVQNMIRESQEFSKSCYWFSTLVSKQSNLKGIYKLLENIEANQIKRIPMGTGNKSSRIVAWTFLSIEEQKEWRETRWKIQS